MMLVTPLDLVLLLMIGLLLRVGAAVTSQDSSPLSSWAKLQISPDTLGSMEFGHFGINVYEHASNHKTSTPRDQCKYYFAPISLLNHTSAVSFLNNVTNQAEMRFRIYFWNTELKTKVVKYVSEVLGLREPVNDHQVQLIPFENVILTSSSSSESFSLPSEWKPINRHQFVDFSLSCSDPKDCNQLASEMRSRPEQFDHFKLRFSLSSQTSHSRKTSIRIESVTSGEMVTSLLQKFGKHKKEVYLTAKDENRMLAEMATKIRIDSFDDSDQVSTISDPEIYKILGELLFSSRKIMTKSNDKIWQSVFWNDDNYRPDKATKTLNEWHSKMDKEDKKKLEESFSNTNKLAVATDVKTPGVKVAASVDSDFSRQGANSNEELSKLYQESKDHVEWDGVKFVPKPMKLSRVNMAKFNDTQAFQDCKVHVRYTTAVLSTPINFAQHADLTITDEWLSLKSEVAHLKTALNTRIREDVVDIGRIPSSCSDLHRIGHTKSGLYSVMGTKMVETVYCNFLSNGEEKQKWIGYNDVKSLPTYFYVQRNTPFFIMNIPIPFHLEKLNVGNAMNLKTGKFTAPRAGTYYFFFTGVAQFPKSPTLLQLGVSLCLNGHKIGMGWVEEANTANFQSSPLTIQSTVHLQSGDQVWVQIFAMSAGVSLFECCDYYFTLFSGWVLQEDIVKSLK